MADILDHAPTWRDQLSGGEVTSSDLYISLGPPASNPQQIGLELFVSIEIEDDDDGEPAWTWRYGINEDDAGFGEAEFDSGQAEDLADAKLDCWNSVVTLLRAEGHSDSEIIAST